MCQLFCLTVHDPAKRDQIILDAWETMSSTQKDGFGAAWFSPDGEMGFYRRRFPIIVGGPPEPPQIPEFIDERKATVLAKPDAYFAESNDVPSDGGFLIIHGRNATGTIKLENTHPFVLEYDGALAAMIHNGAVASFKYHNIAEGCTCDSELLMQAYLQGGMDEVVDSIDGQYAFMMLKIDQDKKKTLHVCKDFPKFLYGGKIPGGFAFGTTHTLLLKIGAHIFGEMKDNSLVVFDGPETRTMSRFEKKLYHCPPKVTRARSDERTSHDSVWPKIEVPMLEGPTEDVDLEQLEIERQEQEELRYSAGV